MTKSVVSQSYQTYRKLTLIIYLPILQNTFHQWLIAYRSNENNALLQLKALLYEDIFRLKEGKRKRKRDKVEIFLDLVPTELPLPAKHQINGGTATGLPDETSFMELEALKLKI